MSRSGFDLCRDAMAVVGVTAPEQSVLLTLAVMANDDAQCWPGIAKLVELTKLSERTVQRAVQGLKEAQHLNWVEKPGRGRIYVVHPRHSGTHAEAAPATVAPRQPDTRQSDTPVTVTPTPATVAPKQPRTTIPQKATPSSESVREPAPRYHRLPIDWEPPAVLSFAVAAKVSQWPPGKTDDELASFRGWAANAKNENGKGKKLCWNTAWENWLRRADDDWRSKPANRNGLGSGNGLFDASVRWARGEPDPHYDQRAVANR